jgi:alkanesulfonate monooxygenase SsuD/methylene tetrahydromethanopterin reductase-like flavin-dependent oxidoreductase (luciferase family)
MVTAPSRRRPWKLARETVTLDHLSKGRLIVAVGLGAAADDGGFYKVGEAMDLRTRAEMLDEGLAILQGLWSGAPYTHQGRHYHVDAMTMLPRPVQSPRVPIWVVAAWPRPRSVARARRWDGMIPQKVGLTPDDVAEVRAACSDLEAFDIVVDGTSQTADDVRPFERAGATWWLETCWTTAPAELYKSGGLAPIRQRIRQGPCRE